MRMVLGESTDQTIRRAPRSTTDMRADDIPEGPRHLLRALRHRNYRLFFIGQLISVSGTWMQSVAQSWLVYRLTGSAVWLGVVSFVALLPVFALAPLGGALADRRRRHRIILITQCLSMALALTLGVLTLSGRIELWQVLTLASALGVVNAADIPARQAFVVELVGKQDLLNAIALNSSVFNMARIVGPALAGLIVAAVGEGWCFIANGLSYIIVIAALLRMRLPPPSPTEIAEPLLRHLAGGFRYVRATPPVRALLLLLGLMSVMAMPYTVLMPIFAGDILHGGPNSLGILMAASGIGALSGALLLAARRGATGLGSWVLGAAAGLGVSLILFAHSRQLWLSVLLLVPVGFCMMVQMASSNTLIQVMVPDHLRGRVMAIYSMMFMGMAPFGALFAGTVASRLSAPATVTIGGVACLGAAALFGRRLPALRAQARALIIGEQMVGGDPPQQLTGSGIKRDT